MLTARVSGSLESAPGVDGESRLQLEAECQRLPTHLRARTAHCPRSPRESRASTRSPRADCPRGESPWSPAPPAQARPSSRWASSFNGAEKHGDPGLFVSFEETSPDLEKNFASQGFDLKRARRRRNSSPSITSASSAARSRRPVSTTSKACSCASGHAIDAIGAKRVVLDTIEVPFQRLHGRDHHPRRDQAPLPLARGPQASRPSSPARAATSHDHSPRPRRVRRRLRRSSSTISSTTQTATRRLRIVKYRGSAPRHQRVLLPHR